MDHLMVRGNDTKCPWVYVSLPRHDRVALIADPAAMGGVRAEAVTDPGLAEEAAAILVRSGVDTFAFTRGRVNGRPPAGGIALLAHRHALTVPLPHRSDEDTDRDLTLYVCSDGLVEVFEYEPPEDQRIPVLCAACGLPLEPGDRVRRACPAATCEKLIHEDCATEKCPICSQEISDPTGESMIWVPEA